MSRHLLFVAEMWKVLLCVFFISFVLAQETVPEVEGSYVDQVCNLIPHSASLYQKRSMVFGAWDNLLQQGTWSYTVDVFKTSACDNNFRNYRLSYTGIYSLTGGRSEAIENFWNIEYRLNTKTLEVFSSSFANYINAEPSCSIVNAAVNSVINIRHADCSLLQITPIKECPTFYDIIRRYRATIWIGSQFVGEDLRWQPNCQKEDRPEFYDPFSFISLTAVDTYDFGVNLDPYLTPSFETSRFDATASDLGLQSYSVAPPAYDPYAYVVSSSRNLVVSFALLLVCALLF